MVLLVTTVTAFVAYSRVAFVQRLAVCVVVLVLPIPQYIVEPDQDPIRPSDELVLLLTTNSLELAPGSQVSLPTCVG